MSRRGQMNRELRRKVQQDWRIEYRAVCRRMARGDWMDTLYVPNSLWFYAWWRAKRRRDRRSR